MEEEEEKLTFKDMGLDHRILEAINSLKWAEPTLIQEKAIPLALEGKDILARARTGSGKTAAFLVPIIQQLLQRKVDKHTEPNTSVLILAPSKELCKQIFRNVQELTKYCSQEISSVDVSPQVDLQAQKPLLLEKPDIIIGTPIRVLSHLQQKNIDVSNSLKTLVIDEADLIFSFGCKADISNVLKHLPPIYQAFLMSATFTEDVKIIKKLILHNPVILKLKESDLPESDKLAQYHIKCEDEDKFVLIYALLKLQLIQGKILIFVSNVDRCYRLKLFLEQFGIPSCVLNSELPASSRCHAVIQFNSGIYNILIASDERMAEEPGPNSTGSKRKRDKSYGVSRGIDFQFVSVVINFDFPLTPQAYIHRVGRTARGNAEGIALSFVSGKEMPLLKQVQDYFTDESGNKTNDFKPYLFKMDELEGFKYRAQDAYRAVTKIAVREARLKEIKSEILNSQNLKSYFEENPRDLQILRHDKPLHIVKLDSHLKNVPDYIVPSMLKNVVPSKNRARNFKNKLQKHKEHESKSKRKFLKKQKDPLESFQFKGLAELESRKKRHKKF